MANQKDLDETYMGTAMLHARLSKATRAQVGAVLVTKQGVTLTGYNGTAVGRPNECEEESIDKDWFVTRVTKAEVIHAELNCIMKAAREGVSCVDATVYVTLAPCVQCAAMMLQAGVKRVLYMNEYRDNSGIKLLQESNVVIQSYNHTIKFKEK
jgi:dCMP deaminase